MEMASLESEWCGTWTISLNGEGGLNQIIGWIGFTALA